MEVLETALNDFWCVTDNLINNAHDEKGSEQNNVFET